MKKVAVALGLFCLAGSSPALAGEVQYLGGFIITDERGSCPNGTRVGDDYYGRHRPAGLEDNGAFSDLNFYSNGLSVGYRIKGPINDKFKRAASVRIGGGSGPDDSQSLRFLSNDRTAKFVQIEGEIRGFDGQPGCTVTFLFGGVRNINF